MSDSDTQLVELRRKLESLEVLRDELGDDLVDRKIAELEARIERVVQTGGGAYIGGSVNVEAGSFTGRDSFNVTGDGNVFGDQSRAYVHKTSGIPPTEATRLFEKAMTLARQKPPVLREDLEAAVETVQEETAAGEDADKSLLNRSLDVLLEKGPDVLEIVIDAVLDPRAAAGKASRMLARHARESLQKRRQSSS